MDPGMPPASYGQTAPGFSTETHKRKTGVGATSMGGLLTLILLPWLVFTCAMFISSQEGWSPFVTGVFLVGMAGSLYMTFQSRKQISQRKALWYMALGLSSACAILFGTVGGLTVYSEYYMQYLFLRESQSYSNVLPAGPAEAYRDAGKIVFADGSKVDSKRSLGMKDSTRYCVAPISDGTPGATVEFWAAGTDCCSSRFNFACDDAWVSEAQAAVVLKDSGLTDLHSHYLAAVKQAEAAFEITSAADPIFVRWVVDPEQVQNNCWRTGFGVLLALSGIGLVLALLTGLIIYAVASRSFSPRQL